MLSLATLSLSACSPAQPPAAKAPEGFVAGKKEDPELAKVKADAQANWKEFVEAFNVKQKGEKFAINSCLYDDKKSEFKWIEVDKVYDDKVVGHLEKDSVYLPNVKAGMAVTVPVADIEDWAFVDAKGNQHGGASRLFCKNALKSKTAIYCQGGPTGPIGAGGGVLAIGINRLLQNRSPVTLLLNLAASSIG
jgi:uncharacterized protein YegJ (DUF2314 family)